MAASVEDIFAVRVSGNALERQSVDDLDETARGVVFVSSPKPPRVGSRVQLDLGVGEDPPSRLAGLVVWSRPPRPGVIAGFRAQLLTPPTGLLDRMRAQVDRVREQVALRESGTKRTAAAMNVQERVSTKTDLKPIVAPGMTAAQPTTPRATEVQRPTTPTAIIGKTPRSTMPDGDIKEMPLRQPPPMDIDFGEFLDPPLTPPEEPLHRTGPQRVTGPIHPPFVPRTVPPPSPPSGQFPPLEPLPPSDPRPMGATPTGTHSRLIPPPGAGSIPRPPSVSAFAALPPLVPRETPEPIEELSPARRATHAKRTADGIRKQATRAGVQLPAPLRMLTPGPGHDQEPERTTVPPRRAPGTPGSLPPLTVRLSFPTVRTYLLHFERFLERGEVYLTEAVQPPIGASVQVVIEVPDGDAPLCVEATVERTIAPPEVPKPGWVARIVDMDGTIAERLMTASFIVAGPSASS